MLWYFARASQDVLIHTYICKFVCTSVLIHLVCGMHALVLRSSFAFDFALILIFLLLASLLLLSFLFLFFAFVTLTCLTQSLWDLHSKLDLC